MSLLNDKRTPKEMSSTSNMEGISYKNVFLVRIINGLILELVNT